MYFFTSMLFLYKKLVQNTSLRPLNRYKTNYTLTYHSQIFRYQDCICRRCRIILRGIVDSPLGGNLDIRVRRVWEHAL